jgi:hypothetical protein
MNFKKGVKILIFILFIVLIVSLANNYFVCQSLQSLRNNLITKNSNSNAQMKHFKNNNSIKNIDSIKVDSKYLNGNLYFKSLVYIDGKEINKNNVDQKIDFENINFKFSDEDGFILYTKTIGSDNFLNVIDSNNLIIIHFSWIDKLDKTIYEKLINVEYFPN